MTIPKPFQQYQVNYTTLLLYIFESGEKVGPLRVECHNDDGTVVTNESGRSLALVMHFLSNNTSVVSLPSIDSFKTCTLMDV